MPTRPLLLIHGYSASGSSFDKWREILLDNGYSKNEIHVLTYRTLTNDVSIDDIAEGFERALRVQAGLDKDEDFDAIVHSTGMLVLRAWLVRGKTRRERLKHLIGLAPATFGSPLAHKGRGWLGGMIKGNREAGPDFMEAGDRVLDCLELGSRYTWDLAEIDMTGKQGFYGETQSTPYVFTFCGMEKYKGFAKLVSEPGTDGTVRLAGCALNTRKIVLDLTLAPGEKPEVRADTAAWSNADISLIPIARLDHGTIMSKPTKELVELVFEGLSVNSTKEFRTYLKKTETHTKAVLNAKKKSLGTWQQFVFRVMDERGQPVPDYFIEFIVKPKGKDWGSLTEVYPKFEMDVHVYAADRSLRCFHVNLDSADISDDSLGIRLIASTGTDLLAYHGYVQKELEVSDEDTGLWDGVIDLTELKSTAMDKTVRFFYPFTTTLVEIRLNREPMPLNGFNELTFFQDGPERRALIVAQQLAEELKQREKNQARLDELLKKLSEEVDVARRR